MDRTLNRVVSLGSPVVVASVAVLIAACSSGSSSRYPSTSAGTMQRVEEGRVLEIREVVIDGQATTLGTAVGGALGGAAGSIAVPRESTQSISADDNGGVVLSGSNNSHISQAATGVGAAAGMIVGRAVEKKLTTKKAQELKIRLGSGEEIIIVQAIKDEGPPFLIDEEVKVHTTRLGETRVFHGDEFPTDPSDENAYIIDETASVGDEHAPVTW